MFKTAILTILAIVPLTVWAQVTDSFTDGDFTANPVWSGTSNVGIDNAFQVTGAENQLRSLATSGGPSTRISYLSTPLSPALDAATGQTTWSFEVQTDFTAPASGRNTNNARVYLLADGADLSGSINGYYVEVVDVAGGNEVVKLFRQSATTEPNW